MALKLNRENLLMVYLLFKDNKKPAEIIYRQLIEIFGGRFAANWERLFDRESANPVEAEIETETNIKSLDKETIKNMEYALIKDALERCGFRQNKAARLLGISPRMLNYKIHKYQIKFRNWKKNG